MLKNRKAAFVLFIVLFLLFWNAMGYLYAVITKGAFHFTAGSDLILPLVVSAVIGGLVFLREKNEDSENGRNKS